MLEILLEEAVEGLTEIGEPSLDELGWAAVVDALLGCVAAPEEEVCCVAELDCTVRVLD
jgi:hypothetical protein